MLARLNPTPLQHKFPPSSPSWKKTRAPTGTSSRFIAEFNRIFEISLIVERNLGIGSFPANQISFPWLHLPGWTADFVDKSVATTNTSEHRREGEFEYTPKGVYSRLRAREIGFVCEIPRLGEGHFGMGRGGGWLSLLSVSVGRLVVISLVSDTLGGEPSLGRGGRMDGNGIEFDNRGGGSVTKSVVKLGEYSCNRSFLFE